MQSSITKRIYLRQFHVFIQIIPIESSMTGNRYLFAPFLYASLTIFTGVQASIGLMGYMKYGDATQQIIIWNLPTHNVIPYILDSVICLGVMLTLPLMNYPVIEILEDLLFAQGKCLFFMNLSTLVFYMYINLPISCLSLCNILFTKFKVVVRNVQCNDFIHEQVGFSAHPNLRTIHGLESQLFKLTFNLWLMKMMMKSSPFWNGCL